MSGGSTSVASSSKDVKPIQAFACLEFDNFTFYIQTLSVTIGRRPPAIQVVDPSGGFQSSNGSTPASKSLPGTIKREPGSGLSPSLAPHVSETRSTSPRMLPATEHNKDLLATNGTGRSDLDVEDLQLPESQQSNLAGDAPSISAETAAELEAHRKRQAKAREQASQVDVDLGNIKAVSRDHARVYFDQGLGSWAITVHGRNGVVVEGRWKAKGETVPLRKRTRIQIAERIFHFALPSTVIGANGELAPAPVEDETSSSDGEVQVDSDDFMSASESEQPLAETAAPFAPQDLYARAPPSPKRKTKKPSAKAQAKQISPPAPEPEPEYELDPIGTTSSRVKLTLKPRQESPETFVTLSGRKSRAAAQKSKAASAASANNPKKKAQQQNTKNGKPQQPKISQLTVQPVAQMEDWFGRPEKPPFSFASLVAQAITQNAPFKLTSAAICEWIAWKYPWFEANKEKVAWQNSVQQNLTVHTIFLKIPRQSDEPGKGNFWLMDPQQTHTFDGHNFTSQPIKAGSAVAQGHDVYAAKERAKAANAREMEEWERRRDEGEDVGPHGGLPGIGMNPPGPTSSIPPTATTPIPKPPAPAESEQEHVPSPAPPEPTPTKSAKVSPSKSPAPSTARAVSTQPSPQPVASTSAPPPVRAATKSPAPATKAKPVKSEKAAQKQPAPPAPATPTTASPAPPAAQAATTPQPTPQAQAAASGTAPIPIIIGPIPDSYVRPTPPPNAPPPKDEISAQLLREPPVILHENKLILSPVIFAHLKPTQIEELSKLGASKAIGVLQAYIVRHFKEKAKKNKKATSASPSPSPASTATALPTAGAVGSGVNKKRPAAGSPTSSEPPAKKSAH